MKSSLPMYKSDWNSAKSLWEVLGGNHFYCWCWTLFRASAVKRARFLKSRTNFSRYISKKETFCSQEMNSWVELLMIMSVPEKFRRETVYIVFQVKDKPVDMCITIFRKNLCVSLSSYFFQWNENWCFAYKIRNLVCNFYQKFLIQKFRSLLQDIWKFSA